MSVDVTVTLYGENITVGVSEHGSWGDVLHAICTASDLDPLMCSLWDAAGAVPSEKLLRDSHLGESIEIRLSVEMHAVRELNLSGWNVSLHNTALTAKALRDASSVAVSKDILAHLITLIPLNSTAFLNVDPLLNAVRYNQHGNIRSLVELGADIEYAPESRQTALLKAAWRSPVDTVEVLLALGANVDAPDYEGMTPLMKATKADRPPEVITALLRAGASLEVANNLQQRAVFYASETVLRLLLDSGAEVACCDHLGNTPLMYAASKKTRHVELLLEKGASARVANKKGETPLHLAIRSGALASAERLVRAGSDPEAVDAGGSTPLMQAANLAPSLFPLVLTVLKGGSLPESN